MKNINSRVLLSAVCVVSILVGFTKVNAAPVRFDQVVQVVNARPGDAGTSVFSSLRLAGDYSFPIDDDEDNKKKLSAPPPVQDDRVIIETRTDIVRDEDCDCEEVLVGRRGFPKWALLGLAAIPIAFILINRRRDTPTPTPPFTPTPELTPTPTPGMTPTPTPGMTPTPTPKFTPTPTPMITPSPTPPEPIPEPMTILLFGTGLASVGLAARRRFGKKGERSEEKEEE